MDTNKGHCTLRLRHGNSSALKDYDNDIAGTWLTNIKA